MRGNCFVSASWSLATWRSRRAMCSCWDWTVWVRSVSWCRILVLRGVCVEAGELMGGVFGVVRSTM